MAQPWHNKRSRPGSYCYLLAKEVAHEADGTTVGSGNASEPPVAGVSGTWPAARWEAHAKIGSATCHSRRRKDKRISESKLHGIVSCNPVALLTRGSLR